MKTINDYTEKREQRREFLTLLSQSNMITGIDVISDEYPGFDFDKDDARYWIFDKCVDGANLFDYLALAIDQCQGEDDGIELIIDIWEGLEGKENDLHGPPVDDPKPKKLKLEVAPIRNLAQEESLKEDAQAAECYWTIYLNEDIEESVNWLNNHEYPIDHIGFERGEPKYLPTKLDSSKFIWRSPDFNWIKWYQENKVKGTSRPKSVSYSTYEEILPMVKGSRVWLFDMGNYKMPGGFELSMFKAWEEASGNNRIKLFKAFPEFFMGPKKD